MSTECYSSLTDYNNFLKEEKRQFADRYYKKFSSDKKQDDFETIAVIGIGAFGRVVLIKQKDSEDTFYASKIMSKKHLIYTKQVQNVLTEKRILQSLNSSFTTNLQYFFMDNSYVHLVMAFLAGGDFYNLLQNAGPFFEKDARFYAAQIIYALEYLHYLNIIYRDIKPENLLIDAKGYLKLTDFGLSKIIMGRTYTMCGTPDYIAPEIIANRGYGCAVDFWSLGIVIYEMCAGYVPFLAPDLMRLYEMICGMKYTIPDTFSDELQDLVKYLIHTDLTRRLGNLVNGIDDIKNHRWFGAIDWLALLNGTAQPPQVPFLTGPDDIDNFDLPYGCDELHVSDHDLYEDEFKEF